MKTFITPKPMIQNLLILFTAMSLSSCGGNNNSDDGIYTPPTSTLIWVAAFTAQNGSAISGQVEVWKENSSGQERIQTLNDLYVSGISGTIQIWLTDNTGADNLSLSTKKLIVDSLTSNYSGAHSFNIPTGNTSSDYTYVVAYNRNSSSHIGKAHLLLPLPPGY